MRSEEHTSELQSLRHLVCRLLLEKKKKKNTDKIDEHTRLIRDKERVRVQSEGGAGAARYLSFPVPSLHGTYAGSIFFFLNDGATPEIYPFPLHAALPI